MLPSIGSNHQSINRVGDGTEIVMIEEEAPEVKPVKVSERQFSKQSWRQDSLRSEKASLLSETSVVETSKGFKPREVKYSEIMEYY
jgi:hypothetical protein